MVYLLIFTDHPALNCTFSNRLKVDSCTVILNPDNELGRLSFHCDGNPAFLRFLLFTPLPGHFDTVGDCITQQVFQRCGDPLKHIAVQLIAGSSHAQLQASFLAGFRCGGTHHSSQTWRRASERRHTGLHQAFLQVATNSGLLCQQALGLTNGFTQHVLKAEQITDRFS